MSSHSHTSGKRSHDTRRTATGESQANESHEPPQKDTTGHVRTYSWVAQNSKEIRNSLTGDKATVKDELQTAQGNSVIAKAVEKLMHAEGWDIEVWDTDPLKSIETAALSTLQATRETWPRGDERIDISDRVSPESLALLEEIYTLLKEDANLQPSRLARWHKDTALESASEEEDQL